MGETTIAWLLFGAYLLVVSTVAFVGIRKVSGFASFSVGSREVSPVFVGLSLAANLTSAATFIINPGLIYLYGISGFIGYAIATPLGIILGLTIMSKAFRQIGDKYTALTVPQWIGDRFEDQRLTLFFAFISLLLITFVVLIVVGLTLVLANVLEIPQWAAMAIVIGFPLVYIMFGGASAHTMTNSAQAVIMVAVALVLIGSGIGYLEGGLGGLLERLRSIDPVLAQPTNPDSLLFRDWFEVVVANFVIGIAIITQPHILSKALYLKSERDMTKYLATGFIVLTLFFLVLVVGLYARVLMPEVDLPPDQIVPTYIVEVFSPGMRALVLIGLVAAGFSTLEGLLVALSTIFSNDIYRQYATRNGRLSLDEIDARGMRYSKYFLLALAPVIALFSYQQIVSPDLSVAIFAQNGVYALFSATFVPIIFGIFTERIRKQVILAAAVMALVVHFGMYYFEIGAYWNNPAVPATFALLTSTAVAVAGWWIWPKPAVAAPSAAPAPESPAS